MARRHTDEKLRFAKLYLSLVFCTPTHENGIYLIDLVSRKLLSARLDLARSLKDLKLHMRLLDRRLHLET